MFTVIYAFEVHAGQSDAFITAWRTLTELIAEHEGGLGSRLHRERPGYFIAYAQWPSREQWEKAGNNMPAHAEEARETMRVSCKKIETLHTLEVVEDLLQSPQKK